MTLKELLKQLNQLAYAQSTNLKSDPEVQIQETDIHKVFYRVEDNTVYIE